MEHDLAARLRRVKSKLAAAARARRKPVMFGAGEHRFRLGPPLPAEEVVTFEQRHGVRLPADYRGFLTTIGHGGPGRFGGAGPYYGLHPLADWDHALLGDPGSAPLAEPFPAEPGRVYENWLSTVAPGDDDEPYRGTLALSDQGCGLISLLVVSGPSRGRIVTNIDRGSGPLFSPDPDFLSWYERWLDAVLADKGHFR